MIMGKSMTEKKTHRMSIDLTLCLGGVPDDDSDDEAGDCPSCDEASMWLDFYP